jgi:hypothetical protein
MRSDPHWPAERQPTAAEWVDWFLANDRAGQEQIASKAIAAHADINRCLSTSLCWIDR